MITVGIKQAVTLIKKALKAGLTPYLEGSPGTGKSDIIRGIAKEYKLKIIDLRLSQMDPTSLDGLPYFNDDHTKSDFIPPAYFPLENDPIPADYKGWLIFFDELSSAPPSVQAASYKIILDKMVGQHAIHKKVIMVAAGNKTTDRAITHRMSTALQARLIHFQLEINSEDWLNWAMENKIDYRIIAYIKFKPMALFQFKPDHNDATFACPRTWHFLSKLITPEPTLSHDLLPMITGTISEGSGREFNAYCQIFDKLPTFDQIVADPKKLEIPTEPSVQYAVTSMIAAKMTKDNVNSLMNFINRLPIEFAIICLQQALRGNVSLLQTKGIKEWMRLNSSDLFS